MEIISDVVGLPYLLPPDRRDRQDYRIHQVRGPVVPTSPARYHLKYSQVEFLLWEWNSVRPAGLGLQPPRGRLPLRGVRQSVRGCPVRTGGGRGRLLLRPEGHLVVNCYLLLLLIINCYR